LIFNIYSFLLTTTIFIFPKVSSSSPLLHSFTLHYLILCYKSNSGVDAPRNSLESTEEETSFSPTRKDGNLNISVSE